MEYTREHLKQVKEARENRDKVLEDWSYEHGGRYSEDNVWSNASINIWFPDWLRNPVLQQTTASSRQKILENKISKKIAFLSLKNKKLMILLQNYQTL